MMNEQQVKTVHRRVKCTLSDAQARFAKWDNHEDMDVIERCEAQIEILQEVLNGA